MPFALIIIALILVIVGLRGTQSDLYCLLRSDFTGQGNFLYWLAAVLLIGMIGYIDKLRPVSDAFIVLMIVSLFLATNKPGTSGGGLFQRINEAIGGLTATTTTAAATPVVMPVTDVTPTTINSVSPSGLSALRSALPSLDTLLKA